MPHCRDLSISMDSLSSGRGEGRSIDWSHPMSNSAHLPPKSPGYSMFGGSSLFEGGNIFNVHSSFPSHGSSHKRTPSAGYLPQLQRPWLEEILESPDGDIVATVKKGSHRRSSSDSAAFQESPYDFKSIVSGQSTAEEEYVCGARGAHMLRNVIPDYNSINRLDEEQLVSVLAKMEPFQRQPKQGAEGTVASRAMIANAVRPSSSGDNWTLERGMRHLLRNSLHGSSNNTVVWENLRKPKPTNVNAESVSDSNSHSEGSNDEQRVSLGKCKSEAQVPNMREGDCSHQGQQEDTQTTSEQIDPSLDPKKAKRILANRQSAQRSRVRKLQYISELEMSVNALQTEVTSLSQQLSLYDHRRAVMTAENVILKQKLATLGQTQRIKEAHSEALMKEVERLSYQHQQQLPPLSPPGFDIPQKKFSKWDLGPQQQHSPLFPTGYELLKQQFSKLDLGAHHHQQQQQLPPLSPTGYELQLQHFSKVDLGSQ